MEFVERGTSEFVISLVVGLLLIAIGTVVLKYRSTFRDRWWGFGYQKYLNVSEEIRSAETKIFGWFAIILGIITIISVMIGGTE